MKPISRREFLYIPALLSFSHSVSIASLKEIKLEKDDKWPITIDVLKDAYVMLDDVESRTRAYGGRLLRGHVRS